VNGILAIVHYHQHLHYAQSPGPDHSLRYSVPAGRVVCVGRSHVLQPDDTQVLAAAAAAAAADVLAQIRFSQPEREQLAAPLVVHWNPHHHYKGTISIYFL